MLFYSIDYYKNWFFKKRLTGFEYESCFIPSWTLSWFLNSFPQVTWRLFLEQFLVGNERFQFVSYFDVFYPRISSFDFDFPSGSERTAHSAPEQQINTGKVAIYLLLPSGQCLRLSVWLCQKFWLDTWKLK